MLNFVILCHDLKTLVNTWKAAVPLPWLTQKIELMLNTKHYHVELLIIQIEIISLI